jgi:5,10-methenyltetrahydrofolate synthetase
MADPAGNSGEDTALFRSRLRREMIAAREAMPADIRHDASAAITSNLWALLSPREPGTIAFCWPVRGEYDCRPLVARLLSVGWRACQPVVVATSSPMVFRQWTVGAAMGQDRHGIPIPATDQSATPTVLLLPLVAFDDRGYRLGYGGGYFDRTLAALNPRPLAIGVGFELGRVDSIGPEHHDIRLDSIVTEARPGCIPANRSLLR